MGRRSVAAEALSGTGSVNELPRTALSPRREFDTQPSYFAAEESKDSLL